MSRIQTPTNQKLLTNVAVVRMKKTGKRFEIACYKNKVLSWRQGVEKDLDEVLQSEVIFSNVSKGQVAKNEDIQKAFPGEDNKEICKIILAKGDLQISDKERAAKQESTFKDIATMLSEKCVNPESKRPYPVSIIEKAMKECHICVNANKSSKVQSKEVLEKIKGHISIEFARMKLKVSLDSEASKSFKTELASFTPLPIVEDVDDGLIILIDPGQYRSLDDIVKKKKISMELLNLKEINEKS